MVPSTTWCVISWKKDSFQPVELKSKSVSSCSLVLCCLTDAFAFVIAHPRHLHRLCPRPSLSSNTLTFTISLLLLFPYSTVMICWKNFVFTSLLYTVVHQVIISIPLCNPCPNYFVICASVQFVTFLATQ